MPPGAEHAADVLGELAGREVVGDGAPAEGVADDEVGAVVGHVAQAARASPVRTRSRSVGRKPELALGDRARRRGRARARGCPSRVGSAST